MKRQKWNPNNFYSPCYFINIYRAILLKFGKDKVFYGRDFLPERETFATSVVALGMSKQDKKKYIVRSNPELTDTDTYVGYFFRDGNDNRVFMNIEVQVVEFTKYSNDIYELIKKKLNKKYRDNIILCVFINREGKIPAIKDINKRLLQEGLSKTYQRKRQIWIVSRTGELVHTIYLVWPKLWYADISLEDECLDPGAVYGVRPVEVRSKRMIVQSDDFEKLL